MKASILCLLLTGCLDASGLVPRDFDSDGDAGAVRMDAPPIGLPDAMALIDATTPTDSTTSACSSDSACVPGESQQSDCGGCSRRTCGKDCRWSACELKQGNACEYGNGLNTRSCTCTTACAYQPNYEYCLPSCQWSAACICNCITPGNCSTCN